MQSNIAQTQDTKLFSADGELTVDGKPIAREKKAVVALNFFGNFLCNSVEEAKGLGNVIIVWEQIPKFAAEHLNTKEGITPNDFSIPFTIYDKKASLTLFPGTFYPKKKGSKPMRRFPGVKEQLVEQALIHHACRQAEEHTVNGDTSYFVTFTINEIGRILSGMGSTMSNTQIREALEVLSSSVMTLSYGENLIRDNRDTILPSFDRNKNAKAGNNGDDIWRVKLHSLIADSILNVTYRQFPFGSMKHYSPPGAALIRRMHFIKTNVATIHPYRFSLLEMKQFAAGLTHVRLSGSLNLVKKELDRMIKDRLLENYTVDDIFPEKRSRGRPVPIDYNFTLYPGQEWIKNMKAGSVRQNVTEQSLGLPRSKRQERQVQIMLPL